MIKVSYKKKFVKINSYWFYDSQDIPQGLISIVHDSKDKIEGALNRDHYTLDTDLHEDETVLFSKLSKNYKYEINKVINDYKLTHDTIININKEDMLKFQFEYNSFCRLKGIKNTFNKRLITELSEKNLLLLTRASLDGKNLAQHLYVVYEGQARLLYSVSNFRQSNEEKLIGKANKWLHWEDMIYLKHNNFHELDWGGVSSKELNDGIDIFKKRFGGTLNKKYFCIVSSNKIINKIINRR